MCSVFPITYPPVAQLDNATDSDSGEREFKSLRAGQRKGITFVVPFFVTRQNRRDWLRVWVAWVGKVAVCRTRVFKCRTLRND